MPTVIDYAGSPPPAREVAAAGHLGAVRYLSGDRTGGGLPGKPISRAEVDDYHAQHLEIGFVWQYGKDGGEVPPDFTRGREGGLADARAAQAKLNELGSPDSPVFFAVDVDMWLDQWNGPGVAYMRAAGEVLGVDRVGIYGHSRVCAWAAEDDVVGHTDSGRRLCWQTAAWSDGERAPEACLYQRPGTAYVGSTPVDVNEVLAADWGNQPRPEATPPAPAPSVTPTPDRRPDYPHTDWTDRFAFGNERQMPPTGVCVHVTVNSPGTPAASVASYQINTQSGSYHKLVQTDGTVLTENTDDWETWSAGPTSNADHLHLSFVVTGTEDENTWLGYDDMLHSGAIEIARWCTQYDIPVQKLGPTDLVAGARGLFGHVDTAQAWHETDHTDPGSGFPWGPFVELVAHYASVAPDTSPTPDHEEDPIMNRITSLIDPRKTFTAEEVISFTDAATWQIRALVYEMARRQGLDPKAVVDAAIAAERSK